MLQPTTYSIGPLMKAARKFQKLNQADVARAIGCSQSALSKMEHNLLVPSAPQWFLFARFTSIPPETIETGVIDRKSKVKINNDQVSMGFKLPKRYKNYRAEKVREIYPFLSYLEKNMSHSHYEEFIKQTGIDREFFLDFDNLINFQLILDAIDYLIKSGKNGRSDIEEIIKYQDGVYWDNYALEWIKFTNAATLLTEFAQEQIFFQTDFQIKIELSGSKTLVSYFPEFHLKQFLTQISPEAIDFLNIYRKLTLENLIQRVLKQTATVELVAETHNSPLGARFEVRNSNVSGLKAI